MRSVGIIFLAAVMTLSIFGQGHVGIFFHPSNIDKSIVFVSSEAADHHHGSISSVGNLSHHYDSGNEDDRGQDCVDGCCVFGCQASTESAYFYLKRSIPQSTKINSLPGPRLYSTLQTAHDRPPRFV